MKVLIDTNVAIFLWMRDDRLTPKARELLADPSTQLVLSQVSVWEICLKNRIGKLPLPATPSVYFPEKIREFGLTYQSITDEAIYLSARLPAHHADPFDRLLLATAITLGIPIVSADTIFSEYPVERIW